jgi:type III restriction enzyme
MPCLMVRTEGAIYLVETKAQQQVSHPNVQRKRRAALAWCDRINTLEAEQRQGLPWHYVLLGEDAVTAWRGKGARLADLLDFARLRPVPMAALQGRLLD